MRLIPTIAPAQDLACPEARPLPIRGQPISARPVDIRRRHTRVHLLDEAADARAEGVDEVAEAAESRVRVDLLDQVARRVQRRLAPHVLEHEPPADPDDYVPPPARPDLDAAADEADVAEQAAEVPVDDEEDAGL